MSFLKKRKEKVLDSGKKVLGFEHAKEGFDFIQTMIDWLKLSFQRVRQGKKEESLESFSQMCARLGVSEEQLKINYKNLALQFYLILMCLCLSVIFWLMAIFEKNYWMTIPFLAFVSLCCALLFKSSYRGFQLACREFVPIHYWYKKKEYWLPAFELPTLKLKKKKISKGASASGVDSDEP